MSRGTKEEMWANPRGEVIWVSPGLAHVMTALGYSPATREGEPVVVDEPAAGEPVKRGRPRRKPSTK